MPLTTFTLGDAVLDTATGRIGVIINIMKNQIVPGLHQGVVDFGATQEMLYFTRLKKTEKPVDSSLDDVLAALADETDSVTTVSQPAPEAVVKATNEGAPKRRGRPRKVVVEPAEEV